MHMIIYCEYNYLWHKGYEHFGLVGEGGAAYTQTFCSRMDF